MNMNNKSQKVNYLVQHTWKINQQMNNQIKKDDRFYLRYNITINKAINFLHQVYKEKKTKDKKQYRFQHPIRIAMMSQLISKQTIADYHMSWLLGILHDLKQDSKIGFYDQNIDKVLQNLLPEEAKRVKGYVNQMTSDTAHQKGKNKSQQIFLMNKMDLIPSWIRIFDKYDNCLRFMNDNAGKSDEELIGYYAVAYKCYKIAIIRHSQIKQRIREQIELFYEYQIFTKIFNRNQKLVEQQIDKYCNLTF